MRLIRFWRRSEARLARFAGLQGEAVARGVVAFVFAWLGATALGAPRAALEGSPLDWTAQAVSVCSVGHITFRAAPRVVGLAEIVVAFALIAFPGARASLLVFTARIVGALLPLVMFRDELWRVFPRSLAGAGIGVLCYALLPLGAGWLGWRARWRHLESDPSIAALLHETPAQSALRLEAWKRACLVGTPLLLLGFVAFRLGWPRYIQWFHARQERITLSEKLAGRLIKKSMPPSGLLGGRKITTWVYLPPGYDRSSERYPVVYVMHGMPGEVRDCFVKGRVQDAAENLIKARAIRPLILVGWDGEGPTGPVDITNFLDRAARLDRANYPMESFIVRELVPYIDRTYRTRPEARFRGLDGVSAGGYAAANLMLKYPNIWKVAASHNGFFSPSDDVENMTEVLGPPGPQWRINDPFRLVNARGPADGLHFYGDIGEGDDLQGEFAHFGAALRGRGIEHEMHLFPGRHTWEYWANHFYDSLRFADRRFNAARPARP